MNKRPLLLLTLSYPFGAGEAFLEFEIEALAKAFSPLVLLPATCRGPQRPVPGGVSVDESLANSEVGFFRKLVRTLIGPFRTIQFLQEVVSRPLLALHPLWIPRLLVATRRVVAARRVIHRWLTDEPIERQGALIYTYWFTGHTLGAVLASTSQSSVQVVTRAHGSDLYEDRYRTPWIPYRRITLAGLDRVYLISRHGLEHLKGRFPAHERVLRLSRLGVRDPGCETKRSTDGVFRIVSCSFCVPVKRLDLLARAVAEWGRRSDRPTVWTHIGDGPERARVEALAERLFPPHVSFDSPGMLSQRELLGFYRDQPIDVFVNVSASEGLPVSIMEATSFGIPVIATRVGGVSEICSSETGTLLSPRPDPTDVAAALERHAEAGPDEVEGWSRRAREVWSEGFSADTNFPEFVESLRNLKGS